MSLTTKSFRVYPKLQNVGRSFVRYNTLYGIFPCSYTDGNRIFRGTKYFVRDSKTDYSRVM